MYFMMAVFVPFNPPNLILLPENMAQVDARLTNLGKKVLDSWVVDSIAATYESIDQVPGYYLTLKNDYYEKPNNDLIEEIEAAYRLQCNQMRSKFILEEMTQRPDDFPTAFAIGKVRCAIWEIENPFPITNWRKQWHQALLENAHAKIIFFNCHK